MAVERASEARMREISWISVFTSRALADLERSWLSLAKRLGCLETWTLDGRDAMVV